MALNLIAEGVSYRAIGRSRGITHQTVANWHKADQAYVGDYSLIFVTDVRFIPMQAKATNQPQRSRSSKRRAIAVLVVVLLAAASYTFISGRPLFSNMVCAKNGDAVVTDVSGYVLRDIDMLSADEGWAIGVDDQKAIALHYNRGAWYYLRLPQTHANPKSFSMASSNEGWSTADTQMLHFKDGCWSTNSDLGLSSFSRYKSVDGVYMVSEDVGLAVGGRVGFQYKDGHWREVDGLANTVLYDVFMTSPNEGWAVGDVFMHFLDGRWQQVESPGAAGSVFMTSRNEGWATSGKDEMLHYVDGKWRLIKVDTYDSEMKYVFMVDASEGWVVGGDHYLGEKYSLILHYENGGWRKVDNPTNEILNSVDMTSSTEGWAVGDGVILPYTGGKWVNAFPASTKP